MVVIQITHDAQSGTMEIKFSNPIPDYAALGLLDKAKDMILMQSKQPNQNIVAASPEALSGLPKPRINGG